MNDNIEYMKKSKKEKPRNTTLEDKQDLCKIVEKNE